MTELVPKIHDTDTAYKAVNFVETYTGRAFYPLSPKVEDVSIIDIGHHLSNQCRYSGATTQFYSTAQHCCVLADYVGKVMKGTPLDQLQILIHDAPESYLIDMVRPVKQHMPEYRKWDKGINQVIRTWLGLGDIPLPTWQDELDSRIVVDERAQVMSDSGLDWQHDLEPLGVEIEPWHPRVAEQHFLARYASYSYKVFGEHQYLRSGWGIPMTAEFRGASFRTLGSDITQKGAFDPRILTDLVEVDLRGGVGRVAMRSENGMMIRDTSAGRFPAPAWKWVHGNFQLTTPGVNDIKLDGETAA